MSGPMFLGCGLGDLLMGRTTLLVGLDDAKDGTLKAYVGARYLGKYIEITDPLDRKTFRDAWASGCKVLLPLPNPKAVREDPQVSP
jgi:hypothetical protein